MSGDALSQSMRHEVRKAQDIERKRDMAKKRKREKSLLFRLMKYLL